MIGLEDIAGISSPEEGRAVGLAILNSRKIWMGAAIAGWGVVAVWVILGVAI